MITFEKLSSNNKEILVQLINKNMEHFTYDKNYTKEYSKMNFVGKMFSKKFIRLLKIGDVYIGYIWYNPPEDKEIKILALFILPAYIHFLNPNVLNFLNDYKLNFEAFEDRIKVATLEKLGFRRETKTVLMVLNIQDYVVNNIKFKNEVSIFTFKKDRHEKDRCYLQNEIFADKNRIKLTIDDIRAEMGQEYYIDDLSLFISRNNTFIGYGQVIYNRDMFMIVNFGILSSYRRRGYGKSLLNAMILKSKGLKINRLYIRVEIGNDIAYKLYKKVGFVERGLVYKWIR